MFFQYMFESLCVITELCDKDKLFCWATFQLMEQSVLPLVEFDRVNVWYYLVGFVTSLF